MQLCQFEEVRKARIFTISLLFPKLTTLFQLQTLLSDYIRRITVTIDRKKK